MPVILVTARGSEEVAIRAREGAASYVPKRLLPGNLAETVASVLELATKRRGEARLRSCLRRHERRLEFEVGNDRDMLAPLVNFLQDNILELGVCNESESLQVGMRRRGAGPCAVSRQSRSQFAAEGKRRPRFLSTREAAHDRIALSRPAHFVKADLNTHEARFVMRDEGPGFDPRELPDPTDPENLLKLSGRGILLMCTFMDDVSFNDKGNEVTMVKRRSA